MSASDATNIVINGLIVVIAATAKKTNDPRIVKIAFIGCRTPVVTVSKIVDNIVKKGF